MEASFRLTDRQTLGLGASNSIQQLYYTTKTGHMILLDMFLYIYLYICCLKHSFFLHLIILFSVADPFSTPFYIMFRQITFRPSHMDYLKNI